MLFHNGIVYVTNDGGSNGATADSLVTLDAAGNHIAEVRAFFRASLWHPVERDHEESPALLRRRRVVVGATLVLGAVALGLALDIRPGDPLFYPATLGVGAIWTVGAFASGRLYLGRAHTRSGTADGQFLSPRDAAVEAFVPRTGRPRG